MKEIWKDIKWYGWLYQVSSLGNVRSLKFWKEKILSPWVEKWYSRVSLWKYKKYKNFSVHRLVAQAFIWLDIEDKNIHVLHRSEKLSDSRLNNNKDNLFLGTHQDNMRDMVNKWRNYSYTKNKFWEQHPKCRVTSKQLKKIKLLLDIGNLTQKEIWKYVWVWQDYVSRVKNWIYRNYINS